MKFSSLFLVSALMIFSLSLNARAEAMRCHGLNTDQTQYAELTGDLVEGNSIEIREYKRTGGLTQGLIPLPKIEFTVQHISPEKQDTLFSGQQQELKKVELIIPNGNMESSTLTIDSTTQYNLSCELLDSEYLIINNNELGNFLSN